MWKLLLHVPNPNCGTYVSPWEIKRRGMMINKLGIVNFRFTLDIKLCFLFPFSPRVMVAAWFQGVTSAHAGLHCPRLEASASVLPASDTQFSSNIHNNCLVGIHRFSSSIQSDCLTGIHSLLSVPGDCLTAIHSLDQVSTATVWLRYSVYFKSQATVWLGYTV